MERAKIAQIFVHFLRKRKVLKQFVNGLTNSRSLDEYLEKETIKPTDWVGGAFAWFVTPFKPGRGVKYSITEWAELSREWRIKCQYLLKHGESSEDTMET